MSDDGAADGAGERGSADDVPPENDGQRFDRLPATPADRTVPGRASREEVVDWWVERFGVPRGTFDDVTLWEKGSGKVWAFRGDAVDPLDAEAVGLKLLRTRQEHWKPTTNAVQRFGREATRNVIELAGESAARFVDGQDQELDWDGDWGYLLVAHELAGAREPIGVGLYLHGELRSVVPKGRRERLSPL